MKRVVVTGLGAITPIGNSVESYWSGLINGKSGAAPITRFDASQFKTQFACEVKGFDPLDFMDRKEARKQDLFAQFAMASVKQAFEDSNLNNDTFDPNMGGVIWGSGIGGLTTLEKEISDFATGEGTPRFNPFLIPKMIIDIVPGHISIKYGLKGVNYSVVSACATSTHALGVAFDYIRLGKASFIVTGGSEAAVTTTAIGGFNALRALSTRNDSPETASRPFDQTRDGFVLGEGSGAIILEDLEHARKRGAKIYAELVGTGMTADAYHMTAPHPEGEGATRVMQMALKEAGMTPDAIDYVNVHGTSTPLGDVAEIKAIQNVFGAAANQCNISSTKSMTGHLLGAAGAIESIASILAIKHQAIPPTINHTTFDPAIDNQLNLTLNKAEERTVNAALSNTFGFGGHNSSLIFKKFEE